MKFDMPLNKNRLSKLENSEFSLMAYQPSLGYLMPRIFWEKNINGTV